MISRACSRSQSKGEPTRRWAGLLFCMLFAVFSCRDNRAGFESQVVGALQRSLAALEDAGEVSNSVFADHAIEEHRLAFEISIQAAQNELQFLSQRDANMRQANCQLVDGPQILDEGCRLIQDASIHLIEMKEAGSQIFIKLALKNLDEAARLMATSDGAAAAARRKIMKAMSYYVGHMEVDSIRSSEEIMRLAMMMTLVFAFLAFVAFRLVLQSRRHARSLEERERTNREYTRKLESIGREVRRLRDLGAAIDATAGILMFDQQHKVETVNEGFRVMRRIASKSIQGETIAGILGLEDDDVVEEIISAVAQRDIWRGEVCGRCEDGTGIWMYVLFYPELDEFEDFEGSLALVLDITENKTTQITLDRTRHLTSLGEMAGGIAHEINNPLSVINGRATVLLKRIATQTIDVEFFQTGLEQIQRTVNRIAKIVDSMRRLSRSDANTQEARPEKVDVIVREAIELIEDKMKRQNIPVTIHDVLVISEAYVLLQGFGLSQILINLISNAVDALEAVEGERWIRVELGRSREQKVQIKVVDSGKGIPKGLREKIMDPFFTTKPAGKGTGLGLSLSQRLAEEHGGRIYYDETASNTTFILEIPELIKERDAA